MASGYSSFPSFAEFSAHANGFSAFNFTAVKFKEISEAEKKASTATATRLAAVDTNAIEGVFTSDRSFAYTVAKQASRWEQLADEKGAHVRPAFEAAMQGYNMVLDLATGTRPLTKTFIRELHSVMLSSQSEFAVHTEVGKQYQQLPKGEYKTQPNYPTKSDGSVHYYASPEDTPLEMRRLVEQCGDPDFLKAHPVVQAAYIHYAFVCVHPFADGNGRVARALASIYLFRNPGVPLVIFDDQKQRYYDALEQADGGNFRSFINFIDQAAVDTMNEIIDNVGADDEESLDSLLKNADSESQKSDTSALRLGDLVFTEMEKQAAKVKASTRFDGELLRGANLSEGIEPGYEQATTNDEAWQFVLVEKPFKIIASVKFAVLRGHSATGSPELLVGVECEIPYGGHIANSLGVYEREVFPVVTESLRRRVEKWCEKVLRGSETAARVR